MSNINIINKKNMKNLIETTTGTLANQMILTHCGDYAGYFQDEAFEIFQMLCGSEFNLWYGNAWMDIMFDRDGNVYAIWAEDSLTCQDARCYYVELEKEYCPRAFEEMKSKLDI